MSTVPGTDDNRRELQAVGDAKEYLQRVRLYDTHINNKLEELGRLEALSTKITSAWRDIAVQQSGSQDKIGDAVAKIIDLQVEINRSVDAYIDLKREVSGMIEKVKNPDQLKLLHKRYVLGETLEQIACEMGTTYRNVCYIHGKALQEIEKMMD